MTNKLLKLINDERRLVSIKSEKGCPNSTSDQCYTDQNDDCSFYDYCKYDHTGCPTIDECMNRDSAGCGTLTTDRCSYDDSCGSDYSWL